MKHPRYLLVAGGVLAAAALFYNDATGQNRPSQAPTEEAQEQDERTRRANEALEQSQQNRSRGSGRRRNFVDANQLNDILNARLTPLEQRVTELEGKLEEYERLDGQVGKLIDILEEIDSAYSAKENLQRLANRVRETERLLAPFGENLQHYITLTNGFLELRTEFRDLNNRLFAQRTEESDDEGIFVHMQREWDYAAGLLQGYEEGQTIRAEIQRLENSIQERGVQTTSGLTVEERETYNRLVALLPAIEEVGLAEQLTAHKREIDQYLKSTQRELSSAELLNTLALGLDGFEGGQDLQRALNAYSALVSEANVQTFRDAQREIDEKIEEFLELLEDDAGLVTREYADATYASMGALNELRASINPAGSSDGQSDEDMLQQLEGLRERFTTIASDLEADVEEYQRTIRVLETNYAGQQEIINQNTGNITALARRLTAAEQRIDELEGRAPSITFEHTDLPPTDAVRLYQAITGAEAENINPHFYGIEHPDDFTGRIAGIYVNSLIDAIEDPQLLLSKLNDAPQGQQWAIAQRAAPLIVQRAYQEAVHAYNRASLEAAGSRIRTALEEAEARYEQTTTGLRAAAGGLMGPEELDAIFGRE